MLDIPELFVTQSTVVGDRRTPSVLSFKRMNKLFDVFFAKYIGLQRCRSSLSHRKNPVIVVLEKFLRQEWQLKESDIPTFLNLLPVLESFDHLKRMRKI